MSIKIIAIDAMGGDVGPAVTVPASLTILKKFPDVRLILVGKADLLTQLLLNYPYDADRLSIQHASEEVGMDELPSHALRTKKDSSMRVAINMVKDGRACACVSAGNTGALMATARFVLKTLPGINRPAIVSTFPSITGRNVRMLDLGANVDSSAENLVQFAIMGSVLCSLVENISRPKVYLLNIGEEEIKGNEQVKHTANLLSKTKIVDYLGYIEGDAIYKGDADVVVCDGFVGNVAVKTTEGVAKFISSLIKESFQRNFIAKLVGLIAKPILKTYLKRIDPALYNGATLIGLKGVVIKSHGSADARAFAHAILEAMINVDKNITHHIQREVERKLSLLAKSK